MLGCNPYLALLGFALVACGGSDAPTITATLGGDVDDWLHGAFPGGTAAEGCATPGEAAEPVVVWGGSVVQPTLPDVSADGASSVCLGVDLCRGWCLPIDHRAVTSSGASVTVEVPLPGDLCARVEGGCDEVMLGVFAQAASGDLGAAHQTPLVAACGPCDDPRCEPAADVCDDPGGCLVASDCEAGDACLVGRCARDAALRFALSWSAYIDVDLYVETPGGDVVYWYETEAGGGVLDVDNLIGGPGSVEQTIFAQPGAGEYRVWAEVFDKAGPPATGATVTLSAQAGPRTLLTTARWLDADTLATERLTVRWPPDPAR